MSRRQLMNSMARHWAVAYSAGTSFSGVHRMANPWRLTITALIEAFLSPTVTSTVNGSCVATTAAHTSPTGVACASLRSLAFQPV